MYKLNFDDPLGVPVMFVSEMKGKNRTKSKLICTRTSMQSKLEVCFATLSETGNSMN